MSYDVYAYPPDSPAPSKGQAEAFLRSLEITPGYVPEPWTEQEIERRERVVAALLEKNPRLRRSEFNFAFMARRRKITEVKARARYQHAELTPPQEDLAMQVTIWRDHAFISVPFGFRGGERKLVFDQMLGYLRAIRQAAGYFAYDRQAGVAFDPINTRTMPSGLYGSILDMFHNAIAKVAQKPPPES
ncbi:MAG: hypothetical protein ABR928_10015 [Terracidiphilus sp.]